MSEGVYLRKAGKQLDWVIDTWGGHVPCYASVDILVRESADRRDVWPLHAKDEGSALIHIRPQLAKGKMVPTKLLITHKKVYPLPEPAGA